MCTHMHLSVLPKNGFIYCCCVVAVVVLEGRAFFPLSMVLAAPPFRFPLVSAQVDTVCWYKNATIKSWLQAQHFSADDGYLYFVNRTQNIAFGMQRDVIGWQDIWYVRALRGSVCARV